MKIVKALIEEKEIFAIVKEEGPGRLFMNLRRNDVYFLPPGELSLAEFKSDYTTNNPTIAAKALEKVTMVPATLANQFV